MNNIDKEVRTLPPFKRLCITIGELPTSYVESMTYYESLLWFTKYLHDTVIPAINENAEAVKELQTKYIELKDYVDNYFENLDVQEEINNKLDEMAEQGELATLITLYLQMGSVLAYDTKSALKGAENVADGTICKTIGDLSYNDGKGNFYKIRKLEEGDVIDDDLLLALTNYDALVAEKLPDYRMNQVESSISTLTNTTIPNIESDIDDIQDTIAKKTMIVIGDSFSCDTQSGTPLWYTYVANALNLNVYTNASDGQGYGTGVNNFLVQLQTANTYFTDKSIIDRIYIMGGLNDLGNTSGLPTPASFGLAITNVLDYANTNFPNIPIYVYGILPFQFYNYYGNNTYLPTRRATEFTEMLSYVATEKPNTFFTQCSSFGLFSPDYFGSENQYNQRHPSSVGEKAIAQLVLTNQRFYGIRNINNNGQCPSLNTTIPIISGTATSVEIIGTDVNYIYLRVNGYDNSSTLKLDLTRLPVNINNNTDRYQYMVTDTQKSVMGWITEEEYFQIASNVLASGTLYINVPYNPLW